LVAVVAKAWSGITDPLDLVLVLVLVVEPFVVVDPFVDDPDVDCPADRVEPEGDEEPAELVDCAAMSVTLHIVERAKREIDLRVMGRFLSIQTMGRHCVGA